MMWLYADEKRFQLIVQWGRFRIFSFFSDPTTYGILMAYMGTFCLALALGPFKMWQRISLAIAGVLMYAAMVYAGSRTPFVLVPAGIAFYTCVTMRKEILIGGALMLVLGTGAMMKSTSNPVIYRLQSAFRPTEDASVQVRLDNQARVQPFIQSHPIGAGLGSTGMWGERFTPDSWLASFAHDSSFVRFAVEAGYIGLFLFMLMLFVIMRMALYYYFRCYDPQIKTFYLGFATVIFMLGLASYPQEVIPIPPTSIIFFILLGAIVRFKDFDTRKPITDEQN
jgi:cell division protein FtsW (lipid II flippase)